MAGGIGRELTGIEFVDCPIRVVNICFIMSSSEMSFSQTNTPS